jgi:D-ribose pyranase
MKKGGVLNPTLAAMIASCQHGDKIMICDSGYPIPYDKKSLDLSVTVNLPRVIDVAKVVLDDLNIEGVIIANEMEMRSKGFYDELMKILPKALVQKISHADFKELAKKEQNIVFVRTGEATPFANLILVSGVIF